MLFNWTIDLGTVLQAIIVLGALARAHSSNRERLVKIETRLDYIETDLRNGPRR